MDLAYPNDMKAPRSGGDSALARRLKRAETTSAVGAGILGGGVALLFAELLKSYGLPLLLLGLVMHAWGMYDRHRLEASAGEGRVWWAEALYWGCWIALIAFAIYVGVARL